MAEFFDSQDHEMLQRRKAPREERGAFLMQIYRSLWRSLRALRSRCGLVPRSEAERSSAGTPLARFSVPVADAPVPMAVLVLPLPAVAPPAARLEEVPPFAPAPDEEAPVPNAVLVEPL